MPRDLPPEWQPDFPPVRSARQVAAAAGAAARAWAPPLPAAELPLVTAYLDMSLLELSCALGQLAQCRPVMRPGVICRNASEPGIYIDAAAQAISYISRDLRGPGHDQPGTGDDQPSTAAITAARTLADATYTAFTAIRQPSGSLPARDAAVSAFMHAIGIIDTAIGNLAACTPSPLAAVLTRQRIRLEQACRSLREALVCSAVSQDDQPSLAAADRVRQLHPILPLRSPPPHDAPGHEAAALAGASHRHHIVQASEQSHRPRRLRGPAQHASRASPAASSTACTVTGPASTAAARSHVHAARRAASGTNDTPACHEEGKK